MLHHNVKALETSRNKTTYITYYLDRHEDTLETEMLYILIWVMVTWPFMYNNSSSHTIKLAHLMHFTLCADIYIIFQWHFNNIKDVFEGPPGGSGG